MLTLIWSLFYFAVGLITGLVVLSTILPSWLYGVPRSLTLAIKGDLRPIAVVYYLAVPIVLPALVAIVAIAVQLIAPSVLEAVLASEAFSWGIGLALVATIANLFSATGRAALAPDFDKVTKRFRRS